MKVRDLMQTTVVSVRDDASLKDVAKTLADNGISGVPVVDAEGIVLGVVSETDIVAKETGHAERKRGGLLGRLLAAPPSWDELRVEARTARQAMTFPAITIEPDRPIAKAAALMTQAYVNRLPVVEDGRLVGLITRSDLVRAFARSDDEIAREIREDVLVRQLWVPAEAVTVAVEAGEVTLTGAVDSEAVVAVLPGVVERVPGVVSVTSNVRLTGERSGARG
jgi:CBS domain-containing protein